MSVEDFNIIDLIEENAQLKLDVAELEDKIEVLENDLESYLEAVRLFAEIVENEVDKELQDETSVSEWIC